CDKAEDLEVPPKGTAYDYVPYCDPLYEDGKPYARRKGNRVEKVVWMKNITMHGDPKPIAINYFTALESDLLVALRAVVGQSRKENILMNAGAWLREHQKLRAFDVALFDDETFIKELRDNKTPGAAP